MKLCDKCGGRDGRGHEVGGLKVEITGYHHNHHDHNGKSWSWAIDLCPSCAGKLKDSMNGLVSSYKEQQ